jgi:hypothetical protein
MNRDQRIGDGVFLSRLMFPESEASDSDEEVRT